MSFTSSLSFRGKDFVAKKKKRKKLTERNDKSVCNYQQLLNTKYETSWYRNTRCENVKNTHQRGSGIVNLKKKKAPVLVELVAI